MPFLFSFVALCCLLTANSVHAEETKSQWFDQVVAPVLAAHCLECHSGNDAECGLDLSRLNSTTQGGDSGPVIVPHESDSSLLWQRIAADEMPPKHPLTEQDKRTIREWIDDGAVWGTSPIDPFAMTTDDRAGYDWWSLQPLQSPVVPEVQQTDWGSNEVDSFILHQLEERGLQPSPQANPRGLVRRLYFNLIGLPPTPEVVEHFASDPSDEAWIKIVDRLLASKHYGERWGRHWLDVVRFGESDGFERNNPRMNAWHYRDWVIDALNDDLAYDEFVRQQLIGDQLTGGIAGAAATGFWVAGVHNTVVGGSKRMKLLARQDELEEVLATVGQTFLGLTVNCARCHDHKFDPISQKEFYQLASSISGLGYGERNERSAEATAQLRETERRLTDISKRLAVIDRQARQQIIAARQTGEAEEPDPPRPFAAWEFDSNLHDQVGTLHVTLHGDARLADGALVLDGKSFASTGRIPINVAEKTLEVWVQLDTLNQAGGGVISIETPNGVVFDSIVFAERDKRQWMAGSNGFVRTDSFAAPQEDSAVQRPVQIVLAYQADGTITGYRDGRVMGKSIRKAPLQKYSAGDAEIVFGLRHRPTGGNRLLKGRIHKAALYDRALSSEEVAAAAGNTVEYVTEEQIANWVPEEKQQTRTELKKRIQELTEVRKQQQAAASRKIYTLTPKTGATTRVLLRGDPETPGDQVAPAAVAAVQGVNSDFQLPADAPEQERRSQLAGWITSPTNPLFSRVIVNRLWHYHFGTGLIDTPNDFGFNGGHPSHPQLLDWLAVYFRDSGMKWKAFHRLLVTSSTYRQSSFVSRDHTATAQDVENRLLWRATPRRLEAESIRDAILVVAGKLNSAIGGPGMMDVSVVANNGTTYYSPIDVDGEEFFRRTVYRFNPRGGRSALLDTFDCPDPASAAPRRAVTTTPLQALSLLNNAFVLRMADYMAERVQEESKHSTADQVNLCWRLAIARLPTSREYELSKNLVEEHGLAALCRGLFNSTEFVLID